MKRKLVENQTFKNKDIFLDGHSWKKCGFINCNIIIEKGDYDVIDYDFIKSRLSARGNAVAILKVCKMFFPQIPLIE